MADSQRDWSDLPKDLLIRIHDSLSGLGGSIYHQLLRSVCPAWRDALPLIGDECRRPLPSSFPHIPSYSQFSADVLTESSDDPPNDFLLVKRNLLVSSDEPNQKWIIQVHQTEPGKLSLFNPLTGSKFQIPPGVELDQMNSLEYRITDLGASFSLTGTNGLSISSPRKLIVLFSAPGSIVLMALSKFEELRFWRPGLEMWSAFRSCGDYDVFSGGIKDIVSYKELFYAVDGEGRLLMFDPLSWQEPVIVTSRPLIQDEELAYYVYIYLVVSEGSLYAVVRITEDLRFDAYFRIQESSFLAAPTRLRVYELKDESGRESRWVEVKSIGDRVFFIGWDSTFSISPSDHGWNLKNRIYFGGIMGKSRKFDMEFGLGAAIYDLDSSHFVQFDRGCDHSVYTRLFWPPPRWISPNASPGPEIDPYEWLRKLCTAEREKRNQYLIYFYSLDD